MTNPQSTKPEVPAGTRPNKPILAYSLALMAQFFFCTCNYFLKRAQKNLSTAQVQGFFFLELGIFCYSIASYKKYPFYFKSPFATKLLIMRVALGMFNTYLIFVAFTLIPISEVTVIGTLGPPIGAVLSTLVFGEKFEKVIVVTGITGIIGVMFIAKPAFLFGTAVVEVGGPQRFLGIILSVVCAFLGAVTMLFIKKVGALTHPISQIYYFGVLTAIAMPVLMMYEGAKAMTGEDIINLLVCGIAGTFGHMCISNAFQFGEAGKIGLFGYTQIIFAFIYEIVLDDRTPDSYSLFGTAIIMCGFMVLVTKALKKPQQVSPPKIDSKPLVAAIKA